MRVVKCLQFALLLSLLVLTILVDSKKTNKKLTPEDKQADRVDRQRQQFEDNENAKNNELTGRTYGRRAKLPKDVWTISARQRQLKCGESYKIFEDGYTHFSINSTGSECKYDFVGSKNDDCAVAILCNGTALNLGANEYLKISDGTEGLLEANGKFSFSNTPFISRNSGSNLHVTFKGNAVGVVCVAYCNEGVEGTSNVKEAQKLPQRKTPSPSFVNAKCVCGKLNNIGRVVNGKDAKKFEFPWIGQMVWSNQIDDGFSRVSICGASLISDSYAVSAAHCMFVPKEPKSKEKVPREIDEFQLLFHAHVMDKPPLEFNESDVAWIPGWNLSTETDESESSVRVDVEKTIVHPFYNPKSYDYDIVLFKLKQKVTLQSGKVATICLPLVSETLGLKTDSDLLLAGWGNPSEKAKASARVLQKVHLPFVDHEECVSLTKPTKRHLCAAFREGGKDACQGDSGGPLIYNPDEDRNQFVLAGIVSSGTGCARPGKPGMYTDVQEIVQWIYHTMGDVPNQKICPR